MRDEFYTELEALKGAPLQAYSVLSKRDSNGVEESILILHFPGKQLWVPLPFGKDPYFGYQRNEQDHVNGN